MDWAKIVGTISSSAPLLGSLFGPGGTAVGALAGSAIKLVAAALGVSPTQEAVISAIQTDPEAALKLAKYEMDNRVELQKLQLQSEQMFLADVQNARSREVETTKATGKRDMNMFVLAWVVIGGWLGMMVGLILLKLFAPAANVATDPILSMLFGSLSTNAGMVVGYFFGSSRGSDTKTDMIYNSGPSNQPKKSMEG